MDQHGHTMKMGWGRFAAMIATSTFIMFFLMYQLVYEADHLTFSVNRLVSSLVMGAVMTAVMLSYMWPMYEGLGTKIAVLAGAVLLGGVLLYVNRSQSLMDDTRFMRAMIPHHSIAVNNARKGDIRDPRVRELADEIIASQMREIRTMGPAQVNYAGALDRDSARRPVQETDADASIRKTDAALGVTKTFLPVTTRPIPHLTGDDVEHPGIETVRPRPPKFREVGLQGWWGVTSRVDP